MEETRRIVVGTDGSPEAREALRWATRLAALRDDEIIAVHVLGLLEERHPVALNLGPGVRLVERGGNAVDVLLEVAAAEDAQLIVVGSRGVGRAPALALGSTSLQVVQRSPVPVLIVPDRAHAAHHLALQRILVAVDGDEDAIPAVRLSAELAAAFRAQVELVHVVEEVDVFPLGPATRTSSEGAADAPARARTEAEPFCACLQDRDVPVHVTVERGEPTEVIREVAARVDADLLVVATRHWGSAADSLLGSSVSRRVVGFAHRPTLVVPVERTTAPAPHRQVARAQG
jgi:nucleotide-binding universal stress UspA family protein